MKLIIASDIHGCLIYTKKLEELIAYEKPEKIILLGDLFYQSSQNFNSLDTKEVANILNKYKDKIIAIRGNCDSEKDTLITKFDITNNYIEINIDNIKFFLTHGHLTNWYLDIIKDNYVLCGHTHIYNLEGQYINPGSVGSPRKNKEHTCIMYENHLLKLINLDNFNIIESKTLKEGK